MVGWALVQQGVAMLLFMLGQWPTYKFYSYLVGSLINIQDFEKNTSIKILCFDLDEVYGWLLHTIDYGMQYLFYFNLQSAGTYLLFSAEFTAQTQVRVLDTGSTFGVKVNTIDLANGV